MFRDGMERLGGFKEGRKRMCGSARSLGSKEGRERKGGGMGMGMGMGVGMEVGDSRGGREVGMDLLFLYTYV